MVKIISIWKWWIIFCNAKRDTRTKYGEYLKSVPAETQDYPISEFMEHLVDDYERECKKIITRRNACSKLYSRIIFEYEVLKDFIYIEDNQIQCMRKHLDALGSNLKEEQHLLEQMSKAWSDANKSGLNKVEDRVITLGGIKKEVEEIKMRIQGLELEIADEVSKIDLRVDEKKKKIANASESFYKYLNKYRYKVKVLQKELDLVGDKYGRMMNYYWHVFTIKLNGIVVRQKKFSEICRLRDVKIPEYDTLFSKERGLINSKIKETIGFEVDV